ncbi:carbamoylphosphate synthase large subunit [Ephemerocybe angulata]|uniref:Carbamoylphosphate synthase large subunit n=1 Tax=Ephemerocybe angulata TaxID=980116 RepID=A0A8H6M442_9AGAR|nr:carbamoylphosphate synthase large subunit [Tulosesus angulatus]
MHYHVCKFSKDVKRSYQVPVPRDDAEGYIAGVMRAVHECGIDLIIPMHEEIFYLAEAAQTNAELRGKLLAPPFPTLIMLHNKWEFAKFLTRNGLGVPRSSLCQSYDDVLELDHNVEWALKPVYGRASTNIFHIQPNEWAKGLRYCTYSVFWDGKVAALSAYPVKDTIDGSSCVYFESVQNPDITEYVDNLAAASPGVSGQIALDLIKSDKDGKMVAIDCNPRATSGIHLYSQTPRLASVMTCHIPVDAPRWTKPIPDHVAPPIHAKRQVAPGMLMWKRASAKSDIKAIAIEYVSHMKRLVFSQDVVWSWKDLTPSLMQPFLLTSYYEICREKGLKLPTMFQHDYIWEPKGYHLEDVRRMLDKQDKKADETFIERSTIPFVSSGD